MKTYKIEANIPYWTIYKTFSDATHLLIAGTTGAGKSTVLGGILNTLLTVYTPRHVGYILIDPKRTELKPFRDVSDFCVGYTTDSKQALKYLNSVIAEIENRYKMLDEMNLRKWDVEKCGPRLIVIIDELADLMISPARKERGRTHRRGKDSQPGSCLVGSRYTSPAKNRLYPPPDVSSIYLRRDREHTAVRTCGSA